LPNLSVLWWTSIARSEITPIQNVSEVFSTLAQISQQVAEFEFPRTALPEVFHFTPLYDTAGREPTAFPYEKLTEQTADLRLDGNSTKSLSADIYNDCRSLSGIRCPIGDFSWWFQ
jgi:hypothetical protein